MNNLTKFVLGTNVAKSSIAIHCNTCQIQHCNTSVTKAYRFIDEHLKRVCNGQSSTVTGFSQSSLVFPVAGSTLELHVHSSIIRWMYNEHIRGRSYTVTSFMTITSTKKENLNMTAVFPLNASHWVDEMACGNVVSKCKP